MPGFDAKRFVAITDQQKEDYMCGICLGLLNNPFAANCCKHLYCKDCINEWLTCSKTCPYSRNVLNKEDLKSANKVKEEMSSMEIRCEFDDCQAVVELKDLDTHIAHCVYNPERKCSTCGLAVGDSNLHNCIELLIAEKEKFKSENIELKSKLNAYKEQLFEVSHHLIKFFKQLTKFLLI